MPWHNATAALRYPKVRARRGRLRQHRKNISEIFLARRGSTEGLEERPTEAVMVCDHGVRPGTAASPTALGELSHFPAVTISLVSPRAKNDESRREGQGRAGAVARRSSCS